MVVIPAPHTTTGRIGVFRNEAHHEQNSEYATPSAKGTQRKPGS